MKRLTLLTLFFLSLPTLARPLRGRSQTKPPAQPAGVRHDCKGLTPKTPKSCTRQPTPGTELVTELIAAADSHSASSHGGPDHWGKMEAAIARGLGTEPEKLTLPERIVAQNAALR